MTMRQSSASLYQFAPHGNVAQYRPTARSADDLPRLSKLLTLRMDFVRPNKKCSTAILRCFGANKVS